MSGKLYWALGASAVVAGVAVALACEKPSSDTSAAPGTFFCNLHGMTPPERVHHAELTERLSCSVQSRQELPDGYAFQLSSQTRLEDVAEWMSLERRCCPFFAFSLELAPADGPTRLRLTGRPGVKAFLKLELGSLFAS